MNNKNGRYLGRAGLTLALALLAGGADARKPGGNDWVKHENLSPVRGEDGKQHAPTCSGYPGTDAKFSFWTKKGKSKNVAVYFEGGGACWDNLTCTFPMDPRIAPINSQLPQDKQIPQFFSMAIDPDANPANYDGLFNTDNPANPVKDWSMVYIPYCTGDLHAGSATKDYVNARAALLPPEVSGALPPLPPTFSLQHRGFDNFMVVLDWMKKNIDDPKNVLVTGSSAGGYGATANFPWIERTFRRANTYVIADASQGVTAPAFDVSDPGRTAWNLQLAPWVFGNNPSSISGPELLRVAAQALPHVRTAQFTTAYDAVQIQFYGVMKQQYQYPGTCPNPAIDWHKQMTDTLLSYGSTLGNFRYYLAQGTYHTLMRRPEFYSENSAGVNFSDWVDDMLINPGRHHGRQFVRDNHDWRDSRGGGSMRQVDFSPDDRSNGRGQSGHGSRGGEWENVACPSCLVNLPCSP